MKNIDNKVSNLLEIINELREKCPWDRKQTLDSLKRLTIEETFELIEAIEKIINTYKKHKRNKSEDFLTVFRRIGIKEFKKDLYDNFTKKE